MGRRLWIYVTKTVRCYIFYILSVCVGAGAASTKDVTDESEAARTGVCISSTELESSLTLLNRSSSVVFRLINIDRYNLFGQAAYPKRTALDSRRTWRRRNFRLGKKNAYSLVGLLQPSFILPLSQLSFVIYVRAEYVKGMKALPQHRSTINHMSSPVSPPKDENGILRSRPQAVHNLPPLPAFMEIFGTQTTTSVEKC